MTEGTKEDTPEKRILELRDWVKSNYEMLLERVVEVNPYGVETMGMIEVRNLVKREAMNRYILLPKAAGDYAESAISPFYERFESDLKNAAPKEMPGMRPNLGKLEEQGKTAIVLDALKALEGRERSPVELAVWLREIVKTRKIDEGEAQLVIRRLEKEGTVFQSKPGWYRRVIG